MRYLLLILTVATFLTACASKPVTVEGAVHPDKLPVYPGATVDNTSSIAGSSGEGTYAKYFDFKSEDGQDKIMEFYKSKMPGATMQGETLTWNFPGAEKGEYIGVRYDAEEKRIRLVECLKAGKHKRDSW